MTCAETAIRRSPRALGRAGLRLAAVLPVLPLSLMAQSAKAPGSSTLFNEWLRQQSPAWKVWDIGGEVRVRYETFHNAGPAFPVRDFQKRGVDNDNDYLWTRQKLHVGYAGNWVQAYVEGRNSNSAGDENPRNPGEDSFDLQQAWLQIGDPKAFPLTLKVGRQEFVYGDERLIGRSDWGNVTRSFDAVKLRYHASSTWIDLFASRVVDPRDDKFNQSNEKDWFSGLYASTRLLLPWQDTEFYCLARNTDAANRANVSSRDIYTVGLRARSLPNRLRGWDYTIEVVHQFGQIQQGNRNRDQNAWAYSVGGGYTWKDAWASPRLGAEYNFSSGDENPNDGQSQTLDNLFPTNHKHYGLMDLVGWRNIHNPQLSLTLRPHPRISTSLACHGFWLADTADFFYPQSGSGRNGLGYARNPAYDSYLGSELNVEVQYAFARWGSLRLSYGHFFPGRYVDQSKAALGGATDADWVSVQVQGTF